MSSRIYVMNAFSFNMMPSSCKGDIFYQEVTRAQAIFKIARNLEDLSFMITTEDIANVLSHELGTEIKGGKEHRCSVSLQNGDKVLVCQYSGSRLPEGSKRLPPNANVRYFWLELYDGGEEEV